MESRVSDVEMSEELLLHDKLSIAVLRFVNMSGDPKQDYIGDGITEEIITALSKIPMMPSLLRTPPCVQGKPVKAQQVGKEFGIHYFWGRCTLSYKLDTSHRTTRRCGHRYHQ